MKAVLCDIEGTTTAIAFAVDVLFPLSYDRMEEYVNTNWKAVQPMFKNEIEPQEAVATLRSWIKADKKETILKTVQGKIWKDAFESGKIKGHVYPDVAPAFRNWKAAGLQIAIYSSGSVEAQQLIFRFSTSGDLTRYIDAYFDTTTGPKREPASYRAIAERLNLPPREIVFLSDVPAELDAAAKAGMQTMQLLREEAKAEENSKHKKGRSFADVLPEL